jgi:hypothetical protein
MDEGAAKARAAQSDERMKNLTFCGLYCGLCAQKARIPKQAAALRKRWPKKATSTSARS